MQQPLPQQHDQIGAQQALAQQMVLCPVRLVYETQILVQPGDQIQPNQTFFINPQNPPPWVQNSLQNSIQQRQTMPNQVVYVQQMPNNIVSSVQQPMDQNQLFLQQNFANFQIHQSMLAQNPQEIRPAMQLANIMPNMVQNIQPTVANERTAQNAQVQNQQMMQNQIVNRPVQNQMNNQVVEVQRQVFMRPQMHQQQNTQRPMMTINQMQNVQQQPMASMPNVVHNVGQTFSQNICRPVRTTVGNNIVNAQPVAKIRENNPSNVERPTFVNNGNVATNVRNFVPNYYRPIQPRPQITPNVVNMPKIQQHIPVQTIQNTPVYNHDKNTPQQNNANNFTIIQQLNNPSVNRKRKSESPDEVQKKMTPNNTLKDNYNTQGISKPIYNQTMMQPSLTVTKLVHEIGTNTSPVHRPKINPQFQIISPQVVKIDNNIENINKETSAILDKDKLIRNTVYTQARGRVLQDKIEEIKPEIVNIEPVKITAVKAVETELQTGKETLKTSEIPKTITEVMRKPETPKTVTEAKKTIETPKTVTEVVKTIETPKTITEARKPIETPKTVTEVIKTTEVTKNITTEAGKCDTEPKSVTEIAAQSTEILKNDIQTATNEIKIELEEETNDINKESNVKEKIVEKTEKKPIENEKIVIKQENLNILTHVVDGYVIQESNFAFPIRKPLKEKTLHTNTKSEENEKKDLLRESIKEELKSTAVDIPLLPFHYLLLDSAREEKLKAEAEQKMEEDESTDDPFHQLQTTTVKSWTVDDLSSHLLKYNWKETVSLLQEHEIDGESLFLVSKQQLLTVGVSEEHADVICMFVKS